MPSVLVPQKGILHCCMKWKWKQNKMWGMATALPQSPCVFSPPQGWYVDPPSINPRHEGGARWPDPRLWQGYIHTHRMLMAPHRQQHRRWGTANTQGLFHGGVVVAASMHHSKSTSQRKVLYGLWYNFTSQMARCVTFAVARISVILEWVQRSAKLSSPPSPDWMWLNK